MAGMTVYTTGPDRKPWLLGVAYTHEVPRIGEALIFKDNTWRVLDVVHPAEDVRGAAINGAWLMVTAADVPWTDKYFHDS